MQTADSEALQKQLKQEEQLKGKKADDKARVDTLSVNINYWKRHAADRHECYTCRRHLDAAEEQRFMQIQVKCMAAFKKRWLPCARSRGLLRSVEDMHFSASLG